VCELHRFGRLNLHYTPAGDGSFSQNIQRLALYAEDSWRVTPKLTVNYGLRWQSTWGYSLFGPK